MYKTILESYEFEFVEKKSRFIGNIAHVKSEEEAFLFIDEIKKIYKTANHNAYAFVVGENDELQRYSDDKEPQKTAGLPMLDILKAQQIKNVCVVGTRFFGGTLLGTGGLVKAYSNCVKGALDISEIVEINLFKQFKLNFEYTLLGKIQYEIAQMNHKIIDTIYTDKVEVIVVVLDLEALKFVSNMLDIFGNKVYVLEVDNYEGAWLLDKFIKV